MVGSIICNVALTLEVKYQTCKARSYTHRKTNPSHFFFIFFFFDIFLKSESIYKTSFAKFLIEWRKSEIFLQLYPETHYVIKPSHYGTYFELRKEIIYRLCSWIIFFFNLWYNLIIFILYNSQFAVVYIIWFYHVVYSAWWAGMCCEDKPSTWVSSFIIWFLLALFIWFWLGLGTFGYWFALELVTFFLRFSGTLVTL